MYRETKRISNKKFSTKCELPVYIRNTDGSLEFIEDLKFRFILSEDKTRQRIRLCRGQKHLLYVNKYYGIKLDSIYFYNEYITIDDIKSLLPTKIIIKKSDPLMIKVREIRFKNLF